MDKLPKQGQDCRCVSSCFRSAAILASAFSTRLVNVLDAAGERVEQRLRFDIPAGSRAVCGEFGKDFG